MMSSSIVCGVEHSAHAREAARCAATLAERLQLRLVIAHALAATGPAFHPTWPGQASADTGDGVLLTRHAGERLVSELVQGVGGPDALGTCSDWPRARTPARSPKKNQPNSS